MTAGVIIECVDHALHPASLSAITAAKQLSDDVQVMVLGQECQTIAEALAKIPGVARVVLADNSIYAQPLAETYAAAITTAFAHCRYYLVAATSFGKNLMPRIAAIQGLPQISDVIAVIDSQTFKHPIYAGNAIETVKVKSERVCLTIRPTAFDPVLMSKTVNAAIVNTEIVDMKKPRIQHLNLEKPLSDRPSLLEADIVLTGGRGLKTAKNFQRMIKIADKLGAAVGASRAAVDAGLAPNSWQVGQTGQTVAPRLYFALGVSGAAQHLAGMKDSTTIVAINQDPDAPIFQVADYGLVGDLDEILPQWEHLLNNAEKS